MKKSFLKIDPRLKKKKEEEKMNKSGSKGFFGGPQISGPKCHRTVGDAVQKPGTTLALLRHCVCGNAIVPAVTPSKSQVQDIFERRV